MPDWCRPSPGSGERDFLNEDWDIPKLHPSVVGTPAG